MKPKILFIVPLPPPVHGSSMVSQYIQESRLIQDEFDCHFVNLSTSRSMDEIGKGGIPKLWRIISTFFTLFGKLLRHRYALCYVAITCHGIGFIKDAPFALLCKLFGCKLVLHQHNKGMSRDCHRWPYRWLMPLVYRNSTVVLLSWHLYPDISAVVSRDQVIICGNGIPDTTEGDVSATRHNDVPHMLFLSNLIESKGIYVLLDACKVLQERGIPFQCDYVGGESKHISGASFRQAITERGLDSCVTYHGPQYGKDKERFFREADLFVFPTFYDNECSPLVLIEAMQYKLPLISTKEGGIPDLVTDGVNGLVCQQQDVTTLVAALETLLTDATLRVAMGQRGHTLYQETMTLEAFEKRLTKILLRIANKAAFGCNDNDNDNDNDDFV